MGERKWVVFRVFSLNLPTGAHSVLNCGAVLNQRSERTLQNRQYPTITHNCQGQPQGQAHSED